MDRNMLERVYPAVLEGFAAMGLSDPHSICRTILLRDGHLVGLRFECGAFQAVVRMGETFLEFLGQDGKIVNRIDLDARSQTAKAA